MPLSLLRRGPRPPPPSIIPAPLPSPSLCDTCKKINFGPSMQSALELKFALPKLSEIETNSCELCCLVRKGWLLNQRLHGASEFYPNGALPPSHRLTWLSDSSIDRDGRRGGCFYAGPNPFGFSAMFCLRAWPPIVDQAKISAVSSDATYCFLPREKAELDRQRVSGWIADCTSNHPKDCHPVDAAFTEALPGLLVFRLIDVQRNCISIFDATQEMKVPRYVALSYVWGIANNLKLSRTNLKNLVVENSLMETFEGFSKHIPRTILHAIQFVRELGLRYLWVDALCLSQDDDEDISRGISVMDRIYETAWFTIIAAAGHNANAALPGVTRLSRTIPKTLRIKPGFELGFVQQFHQLYEDSAYSTRAWT